MKRGRLRPRLMPEAVPLSSSGRWGRRRVRVGQCVAALGAELIYDRWIREGQTIEPGCRVHGTWTPHGPNGPSWPITVEVVANRLWRRGRLFLRCPGCERRATRLYVPVAGFEPRCRRCWGLTYQTRSWNYKGDSRVIARNTTLIWRRNARKAARARYEMRRPLFASSPTVTAAPQPKAPNPVVVDANAVSSTAVLQPATVKPVAENDALSYSFPHEYSWMA
jgi:hypothetical protein